MQRIKRNAGFQHVCDLFVDQRKAEDDSVVRLPSSHPSLDAVEARSLASFVPKSKSWTNDPNVVYAWRRGLINDAIAYVNDATISGRCDK